MEGNITISKDEYFRLRQNSLQLNLLECGGVDNWEWYGDSLNPDGEKDFEEKIIDLKQEIEKR